MAVAASRRIAEALSRLKRASVGEGPGWSLGEDAELVASALWPPLPIAAHIEGRTAGQAARRRWQLAGALKLRQITVAHASASGARLDTPTRTTRCDPIGPVSQLLVYVCAPAGRPAVTLRDLRLLSRLVRYR